MQIITYACKKKQHSKQDTHANTDTVDNATFKEHVDVKLQNHAAPRWRFCLQATYYLHISNLLLPVNQVVQDVPVCHDRANQVDQQVELSIQLVGLMVDVSFPRKMF